MDEVKARYNQVELSRSRAKVKQLTGELDGIKIDRDALAARVKQLESDRAVWKSEAGRLFEDRDRYKAANEALKAELNYPNTSYTSRQKALAQAAAILETQTKEK